jgi:hypothetical protein
MPLISARIADPVNDGFTEETVFKLFLENGEKCQDRIDN